MTLTTRYHNLIRPALTWARTLSMTAGAAIFVSILGLIAQTTLIAALPDSDAGQFVLITAVAETLVAFARFGQTAVTIRTYSANPPATFDWRRDLFGALGFVSPLIALGVAISVLVYRFEPLVIGFVLFSATLLLSIQFMYSLLIGHREYILGNVLLRLPTALMLITAGVMVIVPPLAGLNTALVGFVIIVVVTIGIGLILLTRYGVRGTGAISFRRRWQGLSFVASSASNSIPDEGLIAIAGALVPDANMAGVGVLSLLVNPFSLLQTVMQHILMSENARRRLQNVWLQIGAVWAFALTAGLGAVLLGPLLIRLVFEDRFDAMLPLVPLFVLPGVLRLTEIMPRSYIMGRADPVLLNRFAATQVVIGLLGAAAAFAFIAPLGIAGIALTGASIFGMRNVVGYALLIYMRRKEL